MNLVKSILIELGKYIFEIEILYVQIKYFIILSRVLPILRDKIRGSTLEYFGSHILRLASACKRASEQFIQEDKENDSITYNLLCSQLWGLFPGFCNSPTDILESFKKIAKVLGDTLMQKPDLRTPILQGLRKLINSAEGDEINELARFSKNYLPLLLNIYTTSSNVCEQGQRLSALETIQVNICNAFNFTNLY